MDGKEEHVGHRFQCKVRLVTARRFPLIPVDSRWVSLGPVGSRWARLSHQRELWVQQPTPSRSSPLWRTPPARCATSRGDFPVLFYVSFMSMQWHLYCYIHRRFPLICSTISPIPVSFSSRRKRLCSIGFNPIPSSLIIPEHIRAQGFYTEYFCRIESIPMVSVNQTMIAGLKSSNMCDSIEWFTLENAVWLSAWYPSDGTPISTGKSTEM